MRKAGSSRGEAPRKIQCCGGSGGCSAPSNLEALATAASWAPYRSRGGDAALWTGLGLAAAALVVAFVAFTSTPGPTMLVGAILAIVLAGLAGAVGVWAASYLALVYRLTDQALQVAWLGETTSVPYAAIDAIYTGQRIVGSATPRTLSWPGIYVGSGRARGIGRLRFFSTSPDPATLTVVAV